MKAKTLLLIFNINLYGNGLASKNIVLDLINYLLKNKLLTLNAAD